MQPNHTRTISNQATEQFDTIQMGFDQSAIVHLMDVLTNLYSDSAMAAIREYSSNAQDSHLAAGNSDPIQVFLPGPFNENYRVVDQGVGLSTDDIYNIYSKYGRSTKRGNNVETGMLGLGCKAALAYTTKFKLRAVKDGIKTLAVISRGDDGAGTITILDTSSTDEPNGVTVEIPTVNYTDFNTKAKNFFRYWKPGTVLVDGKEPGEHEGIDLSDNLRIIANSDYRQRHDYVVMGGVPYPVRKNMPSEDLPHNYNVIAWVGMGDVEFVPSREDLLYTDHTNATLERLRKEVNLNVARLSQEEVDNAATAPEAARAFLKWERLNRRSFRVEWNGQVIPERVNINDGPGDSDDPPTFVFNTARYSRKVSSPGSIELDLILSVPQVVNFTNKTVSTTVKAKLAQYYEDNDITSNVTIFTDNRVGAPWSDETTIIDYNDLKEVKLPKVSPQGTIHSKDTFLTYLNGNREYKTEFPTDKEIVLTTSAYESVTPRYLSDQYPSSIIVSLPKNRWNKFKREHKNAITLEEKIQQQIDEIVSQWTLADAVDRHSIKNSSFVRDLVKLRNESIDDPELAKLVKSVDGEPNKALERRYMVASRIAAGMRVERFGRGFDFKVNHGFDLDYVDDIRGRYPLLEYLDSNNAAAMAEYVNLMYGKENK